MLRGSNGRNLHTAWEGGERRPWPCAGRMAEKVAFTGLTLCSSSPPSTLCARLKALLASGHPWWPPWAAGSPWPRERAAAHA